MCRSTRWRRQDVRVLQAGGDARVTTLGGRSCWEPHAEPGFSVQAELTAMWIP